MRNIFRLFVLTEDKIGSLLSSELFIKESNIEGEYISERSTQECLCIGLGDIRRY